MSVLQDGFQKEWIAVIIVKAENQRSVEPIMIKLQNVHQNVDIAVIQTELQIKWIVALQKIAALKTIAVIAVENALWAV